MIQVSKTTFLTKNKDILADKPLNNNNIYLVLQFFIHSNINRYKEICKCLKFNVQLKYFSKIYLINERKYSQKELGLDDNEMKLVEQIIIGVRLKYNTVFVIVKKLKLEGYIVCCNSDIFFDKTLLNLRRTSLSLNAQKSIYMLLRFEYLREKKLGYCKLFVHPQTSAPRPDSQDAWIIHTNHLPPEELLNHLDFELGWPGCDNKIAFIFSVNGYKCYNEPWKVKTYHYHMTQIRNYSTKDLIHPPWLHIEPIL